MFSYRLGYVKISKFVCTWQYFQASLKYSCKIHIEHNLYLGLVTPSSESYSPIDVYNEEEKSFTKLFTGNRYRKMNLPTMSSSSGANALFLLVVP